MTKKTKIKAQKKAEEDANLDEAPETFPASDPLSMTQAPDRSGRAAEKTEETSEGRSAAPGRSQTIGNEVVRCEPILLFEFEPASRGDQQPGDARQSRRLHLDGCATHVIDDIGKRERGNNWGNEEELVSQGKPGIM